MSRKVCRMKKKKKKEDDLSNPEVLAMNHRKHYREEAYVMGFKDGAEYLVGMRFRANEDPLLRPPKEETEEQKELRVGIEKLVKDYEEKVERKNFRFRSEDSKLKGYEELLIKETTDSDLLRERLQVHRNEIVSVSQKSYQAGAILALECVMANMDLDKQSLLANLDVAFKTGRPSMLKESRKEVEARIASYQRQLAANNNGTASESAMEAFQRAMENVSYYREQAYDLGFKDAAEFLIAQWQSFKTFNEEDEQTGAPGSPTLQSRRVAKELNFYKKENEKLQKKVDRLQSRNDELEEQLKDYRKVKKRLKELEAELAKKTSPTPKKQVK